MKKHKHSAKCCLEKKTNKRFTLIGDICGWVGAAIILTAYCLISFGVLYGESATYQIMNIVGSGLMMVLAIARSARPSIVVNAVWMIVGVVAIVNLILLLK